LKLGLFIHRMTGYYGRLLSKEGFFWSFGSAIFAFAVAAGLTIITGKSKCLQTEEI